jgi:thiamine-monophosphate kinase
MHSGIEHALIEALAARLPPAGPRVLAGIGDDAAVVSAGEVCVTSVDAAVDGVHFRLGESERSHADAGFKALASALSDLAAMGVPAGEAYLVLGAPPGLSQPQALAVIDGVSELALETGVSVLGGDVVASPALSLCVTVVGWASSPAEVVYRSGAGIGDLVGVTGALGGAGAGLAVMAGDVRLREPHAEAVLRRARRPRPRLLEGTTLSRAGVTAMIDLSDGLASDGCHLGAASGVQLEIDLSLLPLDIGVEQVAQQLCVEPWRLAASAGEDYELCFCAPPSKRAEIERALLEGCKANVTWIGTASPAADGGAGARFMSGATEVQMRGYEHRW